MGPITDPWGTPLESDKIDDLLKAHTVFSLININLLIAFSESPTMESI